MTKSITERIITLIHATKLDDYNSVTISPQLHEKLVAEFKECVRALPKDFVCDLEVDTIMGMKILVSEQVPEESIVFGKKYEW